MFNKQFVQYVIMTILSAGLTMFGGQAFATNDGELCEFQLTPSGFEIANVKIAHNSMGDAEATVLEVRFFYAQPDTLYTVWIDFRNRARLKKTDDSIEALANDYRDLLDEGKNPLPRGVAPAFASTAGVTAGMGLDLNGIITDGNGNAQFVAILDYDLLKEGAAPVVGAELAMQGLNRVGGYWLRRFQQDPALEASSQIIDEKTGLPRLERATAQGITIVRHPDFITHGHTPGVKNVDHFSAFKGDFPDDCLED